MISRQSAGRAGWLRVLCVVIGVCALPSLAAAQDDAFKKGLEARGDKKWAEVVRNMQNAVKSDAQESTRKVRAGFIGLQGMEYLPHYFLGEAFLNMQDCGAAVTEWSISEQHGAIKSKPEFVAVMQRGLQACAQKGVLLAADYTPLYTSTRQAYIDASALAKRVSDLGAAHRDVWRADADETYAKAKKELDQSLSRLSSAQRTRLATDFAESKAASERAVNILRPLEASLNKTVETIATVTGQAAEVERIINLADETNEALDAFKGSLTDAMQAARKGGRDQLTQARDRLAVGQKTQNPTAVSEAMKYAQTASTTLNQVLEQVKKAARGVFEQQLGEAVRAADEAFARISAAITTLDRRAATKPDLVKPETLATRATLEKQVESLRRRFERARKSEDVSSLTETTRLAGEAQLGLDTLIRSFGPLSLRDRGINPALEEGARLFLQGEYQQALTALEPLVGQTSVPLQLHAHVFRAASLFALFVRAGETNQALRTQALAEIAQVKQLDSSFQPNPRAFSPRFVSLFQNGGTSPGATAQ
jgi:hypothetical protein